MASRFNSQALLDEKAVLSCMAYVDLNPVRAAMTITARYIDDTSVQSRIEHWKKKPKTLLADNCPDNDNSEVRNVRRVITSARNRLCVGVDE